MPKEFRRDEIDLSLTYALGFERRGVDVKVMKLPDAFLKPAFAKEEQYRRADLDGALADGLTATQFADCVSAARDFWSYQAPIASKFAAAWKALGPAVLIDDELIVKLLSGQAANEAREGLKVLATAARGMAFDQESNSYDEQALEELAQKLKLRFRAFMPGLKIDTVRRLVLPESKGPMSPTANGLEAYGLKVIDNALFHCRRGYGGAEELELVANFVVSEVRSGQARFGDGQREALHLISILEQGRSTAREIEVIGSLYEVERIKKAGGSLIAIASAKHFQAYLSHRINVDRIRGDDPSVDRVYLVGSYTNDAGQLIPNDNVAFPQGPEECHYHLHRFAQAGDKGVFRRVADLYRDNSVAIILLAALGAVLKPVLGWAYPHTIVRGMTGCGKSTIRDEFSRLFGWLSFSAGLQFGTQYRAKKLVANSVIPVQVDEIGRVRREHRPIMIGVLNEAYNLGASTHGHLDKRFCLATPIIGWGQDFPLDDVALRGKLIAVPLDPSQKNPEALVACRSLKTVWPMRDWVTFAAGYANEHDMLALVANKQAFLESQIPGDLRSRVSNVGRTLCNYAVILAVSDVMNDFGVEVDVADRVAALARDHLLDAAGGDGGGGSTARQFIDDVITHYQLFGRTLGLLVDWTATGLFIHVRQALNVLHDRRYDVTDPNAMVEMLDIEELGQKSVQHTIGGHKQARFFLITAQTLQALGYEYEPPPGDL